MKKYLSWIILGLMGTLGLVVSIYFAIQPKPIPKIKYSQFSNPEEMAWALTERLRQEIKQTDLIYLGVEPSSTNHLKIWSHFLELLKKEGSGFDLVVMDPHLDHKEMVTHQEEIDLSQEADRFLQGVQNAKAQNKRIAVVLPSLYGTYLIDQTPASTNWLNHQVRGLSLTMAKFPTSRDEEKLALYPCVPEQEDHLGSRNFGCMIINQARSTYRKKYTGPKFTGMVDQVGQFEYLVLFN